MLCIEGHRSTIGSFYARLSPRSCGKKKQHNIYVICHDMITCDKILQQKKIFFSKKSLFLLTQGLLVV